MNKSLIARRFTKAIATYPHESSVQQRIAHKMIDLLDCHLPSPRPQRVVEFGCGTGNYSRLLLDTLHPERLLLNDLCAEMQHPCRSLLNERVSFVAGDAETVDFPIHTELITSCSTLQWFEAPGEFFRRCHQVLSERGYFAFSTFGTENMQEIRQLTGNGLPYLSCEALESLLTPHYQLIHTEEELIPLSFDAPMEVLRHLQSTGVTGISTASWTRASLAHFCTQYNERFACPNGTVSLTYHPIYIIAKKK